MCKVAGIVIVNKPWPLSEKLRMHLDCTRLEEEKQKLTNTSRLFHDEISSHCRIDVIPSDAIGYSSFYIIEPISITQCFKQQDTPEKVETRHQKSLECSDSCIYLTWWEELLWTPRLSVSGTLSVCWSASKTFFYIPLSIRKLMTHSVKRAQSSSSTWRLRAGSWKIPLVERVWPTLTLPASFCHSASLWLYTFLSNGRDSHTNVHRSNFYNNKQFENGIFRKQSND